MATKTSFTKLKGTGIKPGAGNAPPPVKLPPGTKPSVHNGQLLISTGLHELDEILGGGLAVGTILLVEQDIHTEFYLPILKYFLAEGLAISHGLFVSSCDEDPKELIKKLPKNLTEELQETKDAEENDANKAADKPNLTIAWQYGKYLNPQQGSSMVASINQSGSLKGNVVKPFCHSYDLARSLKEEYLNDKQIATASYHDLLESGNSYQSLYNKIYQLMNQEYRSDVPDKTKQRNILRVGLHALGSPMWSSNCTEKGDKSLLQFLHALRGMLRSSLGVCVITIPTHLYSSTFTKQVSHLCDVVVKFESFSGLGTKVPDVFSEYDGLFYIQKLPRLNSFTTHIPETVKFVFKLRRRKLLLEIPHLGPEESRTGNKQEGNATSKESPAAKASTSVLCAPGPPSKPNPLDF